MSNKDVAQPRIVIVHFPGNERERLVRLAKSEQRSISNLAAKFIREGMDRMEETNEEKAA